MKSIYSYMLLLCYAVGYSSCHAHTAAQRSAGITTFSTPVLNTEVTDGHGNPELLGPCTRSRLQQAPYDSWFTKNYDDYQVDSATADGLKTRLAGKKILIFMGTWCGDSRREVPRIYKILDYCGVDTAAVRLIMVGTLDSLSLYKQSPGHEERGWNIFRVPDLIVLDQGREMGRVLESPVNSLEKDLQAITSGAAYPPHYKGAFFLGNLFQQEPLPQIEKELPSVAEQVRPLVSDSTELSVYARILKAKGQPKEAGIALQVNTLIFSAGK